MVRICPRCCQVANSVHCANSSHRQQSILYECLKRNFDDRVNDDQPGHLPYLLHTDLHTASSVAQRDPTACDILTPSQQTSAHRPMGEIQSIAASDQPDHPCLFRGLEEGITARRTSAANRQATLALAGVVPLPLPLAPRASGAATTASVSVEAIAATADLPTGAIAICKQR